MKKLLPLIAICLGISCGNTNTPPVTNSVVDLKSAPAKTNTINNVRIGGVSTNNPTFADGVIYGALLGRRNPDITGQPLIDTAVQLWLQNNKPR